MKRCTIFLLLICVLLGAAVNVSAELKISGNCMYRPRYELITEKNESTGAAVTERKTSDLKHMYRAVVEFSAALDDGWCAGGRLGATSGGMLASMPDVNGVSIERAYIGYKNDKLSLKGGRVPMNGNTIIDTHLYPSDPTEYPFLCALNNSGTGFSGSYCLSDQVSVDAIIKVETNESSVICDTVGADIDQESVDQYTYMLMLPIKLDNLKLTPGVIMSTEGTDFIDSDADTVADINQTVPGALTYGLIADTTVSEVA